MKKQLDRVPCIDCLCFPMCKSVFHRDKGLIHVASRCSIIRKYIFDEKPNLKTNITRADLIRSSFRS